MILPPISCWDENQEPFEEYDYEERTTKRYQAYRPGFTFRFERRSLLMQAIIMPSSAGADSYLFLVDIQKLGFENCL